MDIVASAGNVYRIEPSDGITDAAAYHNRYPGRILKQDDKWFRAVLVSMGCMGVIYSVIIKVVPKFWLKETRSLTTWENIKPELHRGEVFKIPHYELLLNPYKVDGTHHCLVTTRVPDREPIVVPSAKRHRNFFNELISSLP